MDKMLEMVMARAVCTVPVTGRAPTGPKETVQAKALAAAQMSAAVRAMGPEQALAAAQAKAVRGMVQALAAVAAMAQATAAALSRLFNVRRTRL